MTGFTNMQCCRGDDSTYILPFDTVQHQYDFPARICTPQQTAASSSNTDIGMQTTRLTDMQCCRGKSSRHSLATIASSSNTEIGMQTGRLTDMQCCRGESARYSQALSDLNIWFVSSYVFEAVLKNLAVGPWAYIKDNW